MNQQTTQMSLLIFVYLLLLSSVPAESLKDANQCDFDVIFQGTNIITERRLFWVIPSRAVIIECLKRIFLHKITDTIYSLGQNFTKDSRIKVAQESCSNLIKDDSFHFKYLPKGTTQFLWYPLIECKQAHQKPCEGVKDHFETCNHSLENLEITISEKLNTSTYQQNSNIDIRNDLMPSLPWKCQAEYDTSEKSKILMSLYAINISLTKDCSRLLCHPYRILSNITILSFSTSTDLTCRNNLQQNFNSHSCYTHDNAFCFYTLKDSHSQNTMIITTNNTNNLSENEKLVYILKNLANFKRNKWCEHPLNYTKRFRTIHDAYQTYYFCYGNPENTYAKDSWIIKDITDKESLVAINGNVNATKTDSNILLQALIFTNNNINTTIYDALSTSTYIFKHHTDEFNIAVFEAKQSQPDVLEYIKPEKCIITKNKYFNKLTDTRSISSPLNYIAFHNCSLNYKKDDKDLFLFLYNGSSNLEYICNNNTAVILTSLRRENVNVLNSTKFTRSCFDGGIHTQNSEVCEHMIESASDYETRFFHFLIYPLKSTKTSAIQQLAQQLQRPNEIETFTVSFEFNTHPAILGGFTILHQNDTYSSETDYIDELHTRSLQKTIQIFVIASLTNNTRCLEDIEAGKFSVNIHTDEQQRPQYVIGPISSNIFNESCLRILPFDIYKDLHKSKEKGLLRVNIFWPTCQYNMLIAWNVKANHTTSVLDWDYLSSACKARELTLFILCCVLTLMSITGNATGISILILSKLIKKNVFKVYMSLAMAGLILSITSALLALFDTYLLTSGQLTFYNLSDTYSSSLATEQPTGIQQAVLRRYGWSTMTSVAMNISIMSSLMSLALLGILALQQTSSYDGHEINHNRMPKFFNFIDHHISYIILVIWIWNIIFSIIINLEEGSFTGYFDPVTKLTLNTGSNRTLPSITYKVQLGIGFIAVATVTITLSYMYYKSKSKEQGTLIDRQGETAQVIICTFFKMTILVLVSCSPVAVNILSNFFVFNPVLHFLIWWLYITGSSGHWVIFCFSGQCSREIKKILGQVFFTITTHQEEIPLS